MMPLVLPDLTAVIRAGLKRAEGVAEGLVSPFDRTANAYMLEELIQYMGRWW